MLNGYKTYLAALCALIIAICYAVTQFANGEPINIQAIITAFIALALLFFRKGIKEDIVKNR